MSRKVPPPKAARNATTHTPTMSMRLRAASTMPDKAKAPVATHSMVNCKADPQASMLYTLIILYWN